MRGDAGARPQAEVLYEKLRAMLAEVTEDGSYVDREAFLLANKEYHAAVVALAENDAHSFFGTLNSRIVTGPTLTNVNDFRAILVMPPV